MSQQAKKGSGVHSKRKILQHAFNKVAQIVVQLRLPYGEDSALQKKGKNAWFQLSLPDVEELKQLVDPWTNDLADIHRPMYIEVALDASQLAANQVLVLNNRAFSLDSDSSSRGFLPLEHWCLAIDRRHTGVEEDKIQLYKRLIVLVRSLYSYCLLMPAYKVYRQIIGRKLGNIKMVCNVSSTPLNSAALGKATESFSFGEIVTSEGAIFLKTTYRKAVEVRLQESEQLLSSRFIDEYVNSPNTARRFPIVSQSAPTGPGLQDYYSSSVQAQQPRVSMGTPRAQHAHHPPQHQIIHKLHGSSSREELPRAKGLSTSRSTPAVTIQGGVSSEHGAQHVLKGSYTHRLSAPSSVPIDIVPSPKLAPIHDNEDHEHMEPMRRGSTPTTARRVTSRPGTPSGRPETPPLPPMYSSSVPIQIATSPGHPLSNTSSLASLKDGGTPPSGGTVHPRIQPFKTPRMSVDRGSMMGYHQADGRMRSPSPSPGSLNVSYLEGSAVPFPDELTEFVHNCEVIPQLSMFGDDQGTSMIVLADELEELKGDLVSLSTDLGNPILNESASSLTFRDSDGRRLMAGLASELSPSSIHGSMHDARRQQYSHHSTGSVRRPSLSPPIGADQTLPYTDNLSPQYSYGPGANVPIRPPPQQSTFQGHQRRTSSGGYPRYNS